MRNAANTLTMISAAQVITRAVISSACATLAFVGAPVGEGLRVGAVADVAQLDREVRKGRHDDDEHPAGPVPPRAALHPLRVAVPGAAGFLARCGVRLGDRPADAEPVDAAADQPEQRRYEGERAQRPAVLHLHARGAQRPHRRVDAVQVVRAATRPYGRRGRTPSADHASRPAPYDSLCTFVARQEVRIDLLMSHSWSFADWLPPRGGSGCESRPHAGEEEAR
ncbi:hypothetical protein Scani_32130 [Streptomyces caniferus]|uniref:Uncharacterized protein n=1 Tax=Streptomyces caniferus TaxID=285557 RepID=A0A640SBJ7_9ACTN|nr:hypothetical protein Scani_32130 [Streptomyces caniferus]